MKLCGWRARIVDAADDLHAAALESPRLQWIVLACAPDSLSDDAARALQAIVRERPVLVIGEAAPAGTPFATISGVSAGSGAAHVGAADWRGPASARAWTCRDGFEAREVHCEATVETWASAAARPLVLARRAGRGAIATCAFDVGTARDADGAVTALLKHALIFGSSAPVAWLDWSGTVVLRMDDPGGAQNVYLRSWRYPKLTASQWAAIGDELHARDARLSIAYIPAWVDDGDASRGTLHVDGAAAPRIAGAIYPSSTVAYVDTSGEQPCATSDYRAEHAAIQSLRARGVAEVELHGHTHVHPDRAAWIAAANRYDAVGFYRELGAAALSDEPLALGTTLLREQFGVEPTTLVPPGDEWCEEALVRALDLGFELVSSYYLALRHDERFYWCTHVCAPYLDAPDARWFDSELPVVGYFHDKEPALEGVEWLARCLSRWSAAGATRWIDFRELAAATCRSVSLEPSGAGLRLSIDDDGAPPLVRDLRVELYVPHHDGRFDVRLAGAADELSPVERIGDERARVCLVTAAKRTPTV